MKPGPKPCFTIELLSDILAQQALLRDALSPARRAGAAPVARWYVMGSRIPGIFNLGGDLSLFAEKIRARDLGALGWAASHSGAARALIFAPGTIPPGAGGAARQDGGLGGLDGDELAGWMNWLDLVGGGSE